MPSRQIKSGAVRLRLKEVRRVFRLIGEVRQIGADPDQWRPHMIRRLRQLLGAHVVISSEVHFRTTATPGLFHVTDIGWGCDDDKHTWRIASAPPSASRPRASAASACAWTRG